MAGKHRIHVPCGVYHVLLRGIPGYWAMQGFWKRCLIKVRLPGELSLQHAITKKDLTGSSRSRRLSEARGVTGWLAAEKTSRHPYTTASTPVTPPMPRLMILPAMPGLRTSAARATASMTTTREPTNTSRNETQLLHVTAGHIKKEI